MLGLGQASGIMILAELRMFVVLLVCLSPCPQVAQASPPGGVAGTGAQRHHDSDA